MIYDKVAQRSDTSKIFGQFPQNHDGHFERNYGAWRKSLVSAAISFKDPHFAEEEETRIIIIGSLERPEVKIKAVSKGFRPYWERSLFKAYNGKEIVFPLREIIVGPALPSLQIDAVNKLLRTLSLSCNVVKSSISYIAD